MSKEDNFDRMVLFSAILAIIVGFAVTIYLIWVNSQMSYSALYLFPDSYSNYVKPGSNVTFRYGVKSYESKVTQYTIRIYLGNKLVKVDEFKLNPGEVLERNKSIKIPKDVKFPVKISVVLTANNKTYEVHFWLKKKV